MEGFEEALNYVSQIDNDYSNENQNIIINSVTLQNFQQRKQELNTQLTNLNNLSITIQDGKNSYLS